MRSVVPDVHLIELGGVNAYLWTGTQGPTLIDTGFPWTAKTLISEIESAGIRPIDLKRIIITHADIDHVGGLSELKTLTQAHTCCHAVEASYVLGKRTKRPRPGVLGTIARPGMLLLNRRFVHPIDAVDELLVEGNMLPEGFTVLHMPGHAPGQISLFHAERELLIAGDALSNRNGKLSMPPSLFTPNYQSAVESLAKFQKLSYETACFGHGPPILSGASQSINTFIRSLNE